MHSHNSSRTSYVFRAAAALTLAHQVAGKAVRDGLFLAQFPATDLPKAVIAAAVLSVLLGLAFTRSLSRYGPMRLVPGALAAGALLHVAEFAMLRFGGAAARGPVIVLVYLHLAGFGAILLSGFWSVASEALDPREAKREFGRIAGVGTAGGVLGGVIAERFAAWWGGDTLLVLLGALHMGAALALSRVGAAHPSATEPADNVSAWRGAHEAFRRAPFLINLAALVLIGTVSATLLDYVFKSAAAAAYGKGAQLTRYFAFFYTASQLLAFLSQTFAAPVALRRLGLGRTMRWHSGAMVLGAGASMVFPTMVMAPLVRALEAALRGSFFRSSYELFFTPLPPREKRHQNAHRRKLRAHGRRGGRDPALGVAGARRGTVADTDDRARHAAGRNRVLAHTQDGRRLLHRARTRTRKPGHRGRRLRRSRFDDARRALAHDRARRRRAHRAPRAAASNHRNRAFPPGRTAIRRAQPHSRRSIAGTAI
jgi:hypothetical protein